MMRSSVTADLPKSYSDFPQPLAPSERLDEDQIKKRINQLRAGTRGEVELAFMGEHLKNTSPKVVRSMLPDEDSVNPDRSMHLSLQGWIDRFEDRGEFAYDYINRATATDYRLKKAHEHLGHSGLLIAKLPTRETRGGEATHQIESTAVSLIDHLPEDLLTSHLLAEERTGEQKEELSNLAKSILKTLVNQYWGVEIEMLVAKTGKNTDQVMRLIKKINRVAEKEKADLRVVVRNNIAIITRVDENIVVPCLEKGRNQKAYGQNTNPPNDFGGLKKRPKPPTKGVPERGRVKVLEKKNLKLKETIIILQEQVANLTAREAMIEEVLGKNPFEKIEDIETLLQILRVGLSQDMRLGLEEIESSQIIHSPYPTVGQTSSLRKRLEEIVLVSMEREVSKRYVEIMAELEKIVYGIEGRAGVKEERPAGTPLSRRQLKKLLQLAGVLRD